jgi:redox-sensitive bicupin YhaK (pirin superfamily)
MSWFPVGEPECQDRDANSSIDIVLEGRARDLGGFAVRRVLPSMHRRLVGPFIFFDHMGPAEFPPGDGLDVRPHPHIGLATVTYLFDGEIMHRDSLGSAQPIRPGDVNWMTAGRGIAHSERTAPEVRRAGARVHGIQLWVALPHAQEEIEPSFHHHPARTIPSTRRGEVELRVILGEAYGCKSPVEVLSPTFYVEALIPAGAELALPEQYRERAAYLVDGELGCEEAHVAPGSMVVFKPDVPAVLRAKEASRVMLIGGAPLDGPRHIYWNFVSSSEERIERAKADWKERRWATVPGDDREFIPLPEK